MGAAHAEAVAYKARGSQSHIRGNEVQRAALVVGAPTTPVAAAIEQCLEHVDPEALLLTQHSRRPTVPFWKWRTTQTGREQPPSSRFC